MTNPTANENLTPAPAESLNPGDLIRWNTVEGEFVGFLASADEYYSNRVTADRKTMRVPTANVHPR